MAKAFVSKSYTLYSEPTHKELEQAARNSVRQKIEEKLYRDQARLAQAAASISATASTP
jgi:histone acetyltransferase (RNA polymerase elongator complex component)